MDMSANLGHSGIIYNFEGLDHPGGDPAAALLMPPPSYPPAEYTYASPLPGFNPIGDGLEADNSRSMSGSTSYDTTTNWPMYRPDDTFHLTYAVHEVQAPVMDSRPTPTQANIPVSNTGTQATPHDGDGAPSIPELSTAFPFSSEQLALLRRTELRYSQCNTQQRKEIRFQLTATIITGMEKTKLLTPGEKKNVSKVGVMPALTPLAEIDTPFQHVDAWYSTEVQSTKDIPKWGKHWTLRTLYAHFHKPEIARRRAIIYTAETGRVAPVSGDDAQAELDPPDASSDSPVPAGTDATPFHFHQRAITELLTELPESEKTRLTAMRSRIQTPQAW